MWAWVSIWLGLLGLAMCEIYYRDRKEEETY
jgi:hypothetical protein